MPSDEMIGSGRPMRACGGLGVGCGRVDDHPRHVIDTGNPDDDVAYHLDCHAAAGCESCAAQTSGSGGATGGELLDHILNQAGQTIEAENATVQNPES